VSGLIFSFHPYVADRHSFVNQRLGFGGRNDFWLLADRLFNIEATLLKSALVAVLIARFKLLLFCSKAVSFCCASPDTVSGCTDNARKRCIIWSPWPGL